MAEKLASLRKKGGGDKSEPLYAGMWASSVPQTVTIGDSNGVQQSITDAYIILSNNGTISQGTLIKTIDQGLQSPAYMINVYRYKGSAISQLTVTGAYQNYCNIAVIKIS